jgi:hypothetical protein
MSLIEDYLEHDVFGPLVRKGLEQGREQGEHAEALSFLCMIVERLGPIPPALMGRYAGLSTAQIRAESRRALAATSIQELL